MKRLLSLLLALVMVCTLLPMSVLALEENETPPANRVTESGHCGESVIWQLRNGTLTLSGEGEMDVYAEGTFPWSEWKDQIEYVDIGGGITYISGYAFADFQNLRELTFLGDAPDMPYTIIWDCNEVFIYYPIKCEGWDYNKVGSLYGAERTHWISYGDHEHDFAAYTEPPTCEGRGFTDYTCTICGEFYQTDYLPNLGHEFQGNYELAWEATCTDNEMWFDFCIRSCGCVDMLEKEGTALGHDYVKGYCARCGYKSEDAADNICGENLTWAIADGVLTVSGTGPMFNFGSEYGSWDNVPWIEEEYTSVVIEDGVTSIGNCAFYCSPMTSVSIPDSVTSIGNYAFYFCSDLAALDLPDALTSVGDNAFAWCGMAEVTVPGSLKVMGEGMFCFCPNLATVVIEEGVEVVQGFDCDSSLTSVTLPESLTTLGDGAFANCDAMKELVIPANVTSIGSWAFYSDSGWSNYDSIKFCGSAPAFGEDPFLFVTANCYYPEGDASWDAVISDANVNREAELTWTPYTRILSGTCGENTAWNLTGGTLTVSGTGAMEDYSSANGQPWHAYGDLISSVVVEGTVSHIGAYSFYGLDNLISITVEDGVESIAGHSMKYCKNLASVTIPASVTEMGVQTFYGSELLTTAGPMGGGYDVEFGWTEAIPVHAFDSMVQLVSVELPDTLVSIGDSAFLDCFALTSIDLPQGLVSIGKRAFEETALTSVVLPDSVTAIGSEAFQYVPMTELVLSKNLTAIPYAAFSGCDALTAVTVPASVTEIGNKAFENCAVLAEITFEGAAPAMSQDTFGSVTATAYYPAGDASWTEEVRQSYGGAVTWISYGEESIIPGDVDGDGVLNDEDVAQLLWHTLFPDAYPISGSADFNGDGMVDDQDVAYLLWHTLFPDAYPLN